jgi:hypothetical protein
MKTMQAKYPGRCIRTGAAIKPGDNILWHGKGRSELVSTDRVDTITLNNQGVYRTYTQNARGRCIDAPCCGCCTI